MTSRILRSHKLQQQADQLNGGEKESAINNLIKAPQTSHKCSNPPTKNALTTENPQKALITFSRRGRPRKNSLSNYETTLTPPSRSDEFQTGETYLKVLQGVSSVLIFEILEASDAKRMIDISSKTFAYLDSINVDYRALYNAICLVIRLQSEKEELKKEKEGPAFVTKNTHERLMLTFSEVKGAKSIADIVDEDAEFEVARLRIEVELKEEELKKAKEEMEKGETEFLRARENKVACFNKYFEVEAELLEVSGKMAEAQAIVDRVEKQWSETLEQMKQAKDELLCLSV